MNRELTMSYVQQLSESIAEEHSEQITLKNKRLEAQEAYIHELRTRITKYAQEERELEVRRCWLTVSLFS